ncbi:AEC family transporter [Rhodophyticola sp. CCM32]|uniref:AEC family transporter n=1 Tax=Rhodophyticola sp. CCM32 TaxID=2916397 RepID=UPI00107F4547|nr:AEC family transporter [Rhodophyticola sp. CCM32]QBX99335.1 AEC family transporter [Rhodophyticola sp. CCM32]
MGDLISVVLPVFLVIGAGYLAVWRGAFSDSGVDGLMNFTQKFAIPCLLFMAIATLDLGQNFDLRLLVSFYTGSTICFFAGLAGARWLFRRPWEDSVAIGFCCLFANTVLLGLPITERAYGAAALGPNFVIVALHAAFCYLLGITAMEIVRGDSGSPARLIRTVGTAMFRNPLMIGVALGFLVNLAGLTMPGVLTEALNLMIRAALPAALFGLGGVLRRYSPEGDAKVIGFVCVLSLIVHPGIGYLMGRVVTDLAPGPLRSTVVTAAMAPGINTYIFANMYGAARRVAASAVLIGTALSVVTVSAWLAILP